MKTSVFRVLLSVICLNVMLPVICIGLLFSYPSSLAAANKAGSNLLQNGGFENIDNTGMPSHWRNDAWQSGSFVGKSSLKTHSGKNAIMVESNTANDARAVQTIIVKPDTVYRLSGWIYSENITAATTGANLCLLNTSFHSGFYNVSEWRRAEMIFKTHKKQTTVDVAARLGFFNGTVTGRAFFDDISVEEVKEQGVSFNQLSEPAASSVTTSTSTGGIFYSKMILLFYIFILAGLSLSFRRKRFGVFEKEKVILITGVFLIVTAVLVRLPLFPEAAFPGDLGFFRIWAARMADVGPLNFYNKQFFDYPPLTLLILWIPGLVAKITGIPSSDALFGIIVKIPGVLFDFGIAWIIYCLIRDKDKFLGLVLSAVYLLLPSVIYNSVYWGQTDSYYTFFIVLSFYFIVKDKPELAAISAAASFMAKVQAIAFVPILVTFFLTRYSWKRKILSAASGLIFALSLFALFFVNHPLTDIVAFYTRLEGSFPYASLNAANAMSLVFGNASSDLKVLFPGVTVKTVGILLFLVSSISAGVLYLKQKNNGVLAFAFFISAFAFFMFFPRMHERYLYAAFPFVLIAAGLLRDRLIFFCGMILSFTFVMNLHVVVLKYSAEKVLKDDEFERAIYVLAIVSLALLILLFLQYYLEIPLRKAREIKTKIGLYFDAYSKKIGGMLTSPKFKISKRDIIAIAVLLAVYTVFIFFRLGSTETPQNGYRFDNPKKIIEITLPGNSHVEEIVWFDAEETGKVAVEKYDGSKWEPVTMLDNKDYYVIKRIPVKAGAVTRLRLVPSPTGGMVNEIAFLDEKKKPVTPLSIADLFEKKTYSPKDHPLFDEQSRVLAHSSHMNNTYFDEIYHGRTAYEFIKGYPVYEWTHPQLGKVILMPGIKIFGMNHFGMRFMHAVMGIVLILVLFFFGREVFSTRFGAFGAMIAGMLDFMPFAQSRYSTIDTTSVVFITLMFLFTIRYIKVESSGAVLKRKILAIIPVLLFFALSAAVKWTAVYAFAGVFICTAVVKIGQIIDHKREGNGALSAYLKKDFLPVFSFWIVLFVLIVPFLYFVPYYYYVKSQGIKEFFSMESVNAIIKNQKDIFAYHSNLTEPHAYSSRFWSWPFDFKPLFLYQMSSPPAGVKSSIVSFGNPVIWWTGLAAVFVLVYRFVADRKFTLMHYCFIMYLCLYIPWSFVTRAAFIYHYYPLLPLLYLFALTLLEPLWDDRENTRWAVVVFIIFALFLLALFYPVLSGIEIPDWYNNMLKWYPKDWWWS